MSERWTSPDKIGDTSRPVEQSNATGPRGSQTGQGLKMVSLERGMFRALTTEHTQLEKLVTLYWQIVQVAECARNHRRQLGDAWGNEDKIFPELESITDDLPQKLFLPRNRDLDSVGAAFDAFVTARDDLTTNVEEARKFRRLAQEDRNAGLDSALAGVEDGLQSFLSEIMSLQSVCHDEALELLSTIRSDLDRIEGQIAVQDTRPETPIAQANDAPSLAFVSEGGKIQEPGTFGGAGDATTTGAYEPRIQEPRNLG
jgi:hypothetical protein